MKNLLVLLGLFFAVNIFSQKEANLWYFGENAGLDFSTNPPTALTDGQLNTTEGCSSFSSASGELLFYSDGIEVFNKNHALMIYTDGRPANDLKGNPSSTQSGMIIPKPGSTSIYYLFTVGAQFVPPNVTANPGFNFYTIDMSKNSGLGEIIDGPVNLAINPNTRTDLSRAWSEKVTAVKGKTCDSFWVISVVENLFFAYEVDASGVKVSDVVISEVNFNPSDRRGYLQISPNGEKIALADYNARGSSSINGSLVLFDFDSTNGIVNRAPTVLIRESTGQAPYGVAFSRDSKKLYTSTSNGRFNIFQFDLEDTLIAASRTNIATRSGFRGALQLGPNGKIYCSIPDSNFLDVIENPTADAADVVYTRDAINLDGRLTTQGLPPFISSLLLPIEVVDADTGTVINDQDLAFCIGQDKIIESEDIAGSGATYKWTFNNGATPIQTTKDLILTNISTADAGTYSLVVEITDACTNITRFEATFNVAVFEAATANPIIYPAFCDTDNDGFNSFDLIADISPTVLGTQDATVFEILYFKDLTDATASLDPLPNPYTNPSQFSSQIIYARIQNINAPNACYDITEFTLVVTGLPIPTQPAPYKICDNLESGSDTDKTVNTFLLESRDAEILGNLNSTQYVISYHETLNGAQINNVTTSIPKDIAYTVTDTKTVFIRVENKENASCFDASKTLDLIVNPLPQINNAVSLLQCDDDLDRRSTINLTEAEISISSNNLNERFLYYATEADAIAGMPEVTDKLRYPVNQIGEAWVRTISNEDCFRVSKINLEVEASADVAYNKEFAGVCDDLLQADGTDGPTNNDTDGITNFDFSDANAEILDFFPVGLKPDLEIAYYETREDRIAVLNEIADISNYRNSNYPSNVTRQTIYFKITNKNNNNCSGTGELYLKTNTVPTANQVADLELCDAINDGNDTNGIVQNFDLESQTTTILGVQNNTDFTVTYHVTATDAAMGVTPLSSPFENTVRDIQPIYVRIVNNNTGCTTSKTSFNVVVNPLPIANFVEDLQVCDDDTDGSARNGFSQNIDLESQTAGILGMQDATIYAVTYHKSLTEAQNGSNALPSPYANSVPNEETIYIRIYNSNTMCTNGISNFKVIVNPEPTFTPVSNLSYCDDLLDGDDANGIVQNIDLESQIPLLLGASQDPDDFLVTFHANSTEAASGANNLASPYTNTNTTETIFVRIKNKATSCVNDAATFEVIVNKLPEFTVTSPQIVCLNDAPKNIAVENPAEIYSYSWLDAAGTALSVADNLDVNIGGKYTVTATTTDGTNCSRTETIIVNESNAATLLPSYVTIVDEGNNIGSENNLSILIDTISNDLGPGDYQFALINNDTNTTTAFQDETIFENLEGGIYTIIVNDKNGCVPNAMLQVSVLQFPKFFTPNGDGQNDTWVIKGANKSFYPNSKINIFNRFGKIVAQIAIDGQGWDGTYNGKKLSSDDYWFNITLIPADTSKPTVNKTGNFSLLRR